MKLTQTQIKIQRAIQQAFPKARVDFALFDTDAEKQIYTYKIFFPLSCCSDKKLNAVDALNKKIKAWNKKFATYKTFSAKILEVTMHNFKSYEGFASMLIIDYKEQVNMNLMGLVESITTLVNIANEDAYDNELVNLSYNKELQKDVWTINSDSPLLDRKQLSKLSHDTATLEYMQNSIVNGSIFKQSLTDTIDVIIAYNGQSFIVRFETDNANKDFEKLTLLACFQLIYSLDPNSLQLDKENFDNTIQGDKDARDSKDTKAAQ